MPSLTTKKKTPKQTSPRLSSRSARKHAKKAAEERIALARQGAVVRGAVQGNVLCWAKWINKDYLWPPHIRMIAEKLHKLEKGEIKRLIIETPPRHGKTALVSVAFPGWFLGRNPGSRVITASHTATLACVNSRQVRNSLQEHGPKIFGVTVSKDSSAMDRWEIAGDTGGMRAAGVGGNLTGAGASLMVLDDVFKDAEQAYSKLQRDKIWEWYTHVARTRLHTDGKIIVVATRWHADDLTGRLLDSAIEDWDRVRLPAIAEPDDQMGRTPGHALWPEKYPVDELDRVRSQLGSFAWSALYQQRPVSAEGAVIKREWLRYYEDIPGGLKDHMQSWDMSFKESGSSYVVGQVWARKGSRFYLLDQFRRRVSFVDTVKAVRQMSEKWPECKAKLIEDKANGPAVISVLSESIPGIIPISPKGSKESRLRSVEPNFEAGNVYLPNPDHNPWVSVLEEELVSFPKAPYDDQVDALSMALNRYRQDGPSVSISLGTGTRPSPWKV